MAYLAAAAALAYTSLGRTTTAAAGGKCNGLDCVREAREMKVLGNRLLLGRMIFIHTHTHILGRLHVCVCVSRGIMRWRVRTGAI